MARQTTRAGGFLLAAAILGGTILGVAMGEPSKGMIAGAIGGVLVALMIWQSDRRRR
jgi:hypothetical protein